MLALAAVLALCAAAVVGVGIWAATRRRQQVDDSSDFTVPVSMIDSDGPAGGHDCTDCPTGDCGCDGGDCGGGDAGGD